MFGVFGGKSGIWTDSKGSRLMKAIASSSHWWSLLVWCSAQSLHRGVVGIVCQYCIQEKPIKSFLLISGCHGRMDGDVSRLHWQIMKAKFDEHHLSK